MRVLEGIDHREHGAYVKVLIHPKTVGSKKLKVSIGFVNPGEKIIPNKHEEEEAFFFIQGQGSALVEGFGKVKIKKNTILWAPSNAKHTFSNTSDEPLIFIAAKA
jgi:mannose-6-phosphate isomerase-like protein (cupin superfamily)